MSESRDRTKGKHRVRLGPEEKTRSCQGSGTAVTLGFTLRNCCIKVRGWRGGHPRDQRDSQYSKKAGAGSDWSPRWGSVIAEVREWSLLGSHRETDIVVSDEVKVSVRLWMGSNQGLDQGQMLRCTIKGQGQVYLVSRGQAQGQMGSRVIGKVILSEVRDHGL